MIKVSIQEEDITIINIYMYPKIGAPQHIRQILRALREDINSNTVVVVNYKTPLSSMDRSSRQINKETQALNETLDLVDLIDIY